MNTSTCSINAYTVIHEGCPFRFQVRDSHDVEVSLGGSDRPLTLLFDAEAFRQFIEQGGEAMQKMTVAETESE